MRDLIQSMTTVDETELYLETYKYDPHPEIKHTPVTSAWFPEITNVKTYVTEPYRYVRETISFNSEQERDEYYEKLMDNYEKEFC